MSSTSPRSEESTITIPSRGADTPTKLYKGGCHCGQFQFECRHSILEDGSEVAKCNCSICVQRGYLMIWITNPKEDFKLLKGDDADLTRYAFHKKIVTHSFCPVCGSGLFAEWVRGEQKIICLNVRNIQGLDLEKLTLKKINGRAF